MCVARARGHRSRVQCQLTLSGKFTSGKFASGKFASGQLVLLKQVRLVPGGRQSSERGEECPASPEFAGDRPDFLLGINPYSALNVGFLFCFTQPFIECFLLDIARSWFQGVRGAAGSRGKRWDPGRHNREQQERRTPSRGYKTVGSKLDPTLSSTES